MTSSVLSAAARPSRRARPLLLLLPPLLLLLGLLHLARREPLSGPTPPPDVSSPDETVSALTGELSGAAGGWLVATLAPLHADPQRQAFEAAALTRELGLEPGQPWRLSVRWEAGEAGAEEDAAAQGAGSRGAESVPAGESVAQVRPAGIELGPVSVEDEAGLALRSLDDPPPRAEGEPTPPLRTLLAPPVGALRPGRTADWILWGRAPGAGARLVGLTPRADPVFQAATGFEGPFPLRATRVRRGDLGQPLARLERAPNGKTAGAGASQTGHGEDRGDGR
jgi:hypothetical protein